MLKVKPVHKLKNELAKVKETTIWKKLFVSKIDEEKMRELKAEQMIKYGYRNFF